MMPFPVGDRPPGPKWPKDFAPPGYKDDPPTAETAVNTLKQAMSEGTVGPYQNKYWDQESVTNAIEKAIEEADAAGADPEKLRVAREVLKCKALPEKADRFW